MKFTSHVEHFESVLWGYHLPVPGDIAAHFVEGTHRRVKCTLNGQVTKQCALMPSKGEYFILLNKNNITKLQLKVGDLVQVELEKDTSTYGLDMPEEFQVCLEQEEEGAKWFEKLTPGKQRSLIFLVSSVKNTDSRIRKSLAILHQLCESNGNLDFRRINELIKQYNQQK
jgi:hypothetical protein